MQTSNADFGCPRNGLKASNNLWLSAECFEGFQCRFRLSAAWLEGFQKILQLSAEWLFEGFQYQLRLSAEWFEGF
jgi:hypothetical protein